MASDIDATYYLQADRADGDEVAPLVEFMAHKGMLGRQTHRTNFPFDSSSLYLDEAGVLSAHSKGEVRWEDFEEQMLSLSTAFPETLFTLHSSGSHEDLNRRTYYKHGRAQLESAQVSYAPFDETKLGNAAR